MRHRTHTEGDFIAKRLKHSGMLKTDSSLTPFDRSCHAGLHYPACRKQIISGKLSGVADPKLFPKVVAIRKEAHYKKCASDRRLTIGLRCRIRRFGCVQPTGSFAR